jgi:hypothetical protein
MTTHINRESTQREACSKVPYSMIRNAHIKQAQTTKEVIIQQDTYATESTSLMVKHGP